MEITHVPMICKPDKDGKPAEFAGSVRIRVPNYFEYHEIIENSGIEYDEKGEVLLEKGKGAVKLLCELAKLSEKFYVAVDIKRLSDGFTATSFNDLQSDRDFFPVVTEIGGLILSYFRKMKGNA